MNEKHYVRDQYRERHGSGLSLVYFNVICLGRQKMKAEGHKEDS